jgi:hypothetical protein
MMISDLKCQHFEYGMWAIYTSLAVAAYTIFPVNFIVNFGSCGASRKDWGRRRALLDALAPFRLSAFVWNAMPINSNE